MSVETPPWMGLVEAAFALVITGMLVLRFAGKMQGNRRVVRVRYYAMAPGDDAPRYRVRSISGRTTWILSEEFATTHSRWNLWEWFMACQEATNQGREVYREVINR